MGIVSSKIIEKTIQATGVQRVRVAFIDHLGKEHRRSHDFPKGANINKAIANMIPLIESSLKSQEIEQVIQQIEKGESFQLDYASDVDLKTRLQELEVKKQTEIDTLTSEKTNINMEANKL